jgi:hypothetical protein
VAQSIVEYTGQRMGTVTYRGRSSGREYRFDASCWHKRQYVLDEDLDLFRAHSEFQVRPEGRIDHDADEQRRREETMARLLARVDELEGKPRTEAADGSGVQTPQRTARRPGGRPRIPELELQKLWHLRHHCFSAWPLDALAAEFLSDDYWTPRSTISTRLSRFKKAHPELTDEDTCPFCREGYSPEPPGKS